MRVIDMLDADDVGDEVMGKWWRMSHCQWIMGVMTYDMRQYEVSTSNERGTGFMYNRRLTDF